MNQDPSKSLEELYKLNQDYYICPATDGNEMVRIAQRMASILAYLENVRSQVHQMWQQRVNELIHEDKWSVNKAENQAHVDFPMMYQLRRTMEGHKTVLDVIRSQLSMLKEERKNS
jgi:hypothetical protein